MVKGKSNFDKYLPVMTQDGFATFRIHFKSTRVCHNTFKTNDVTLHSSPQLMVLPDSKSILNEILCIIGC